ncbi:hypothetical protein [Streptomyces sp. Tue6028]|uniref:hypothetical protein n=1 Tax=Streptomyces sp. Tue6028 TaxID=2036037 RepID=UPI003D73DAE0
MNLQEMETERVRELLGRAVDDVRTPHGRDSETVFAQASRLRWRRRAATTGVTAAAVAAALLLGSGLLDDRGRETSVAGRPTAGELTSRAGRFAKLLPAGTGRISEVSLLRLVKQVPKAPLPKPVGPYDGDYAVSRDGGVGYISVHLSTAKEVEAKTGGLGLQDPCKDSPRDGTVDCTSEKLPNGNVLGIHRTGAPDPGTYSYPTWGPEFVATLQLSDGRVLHVRANGGFQGKGQLGPLLKTPPLDRDQLRKLTLNPKLLP